MKICPTCGIEFFDSKHPEKVHCSNECYATSRRETRACPGCGNSFETTKGSTKKFCTAACGFKHRHRPHDPDKKSIFTCGWCNKEFEEWAYRKPRFCSKQCMSEYAARQPRFKRRKPENYINLNCKVCGKGYRVHKTFIEIRRSVYCSAECRDHDNGLRMQGDGNPNYKGGTIRYRGRNWDSQKRKALRRDGFKCQICGKKLGKKRHDYGVHHIIPYRAFNGDYAQANQLNNLVTLCRKCHSHVERGKLPCPKPLI